MVEGNKVFNFSAGPCILPKEVLKKAQEELLDWHGTGLSPMEMSHRGKEFWEITCTAKDDLRAFLQIPEDFHIMFMSGGASLMFTVIPLNLLNGKKRANYMTTGVWSSLAFEEAKNHCEPHEVFPQSEGKFNRVPEADEVSIDPEGAFFHFCLNETVHGVMANDFPWEKIPQGMPVVCDMSSCICSEPVDWQRYDLIYAGAQKNMGPAGVTVVIFKDTVLDMAKLGTANLLDVTKFWKSPQTYYNTPATWSVYVAGLNFAYMRKQGLEYVTEFNKKKAKILYDAIEGSNGYYESPVVAKYRSLMNVPFTVGGSQELAEKFAREAGEKGMPYLKGHAKVGGIRASIYNAMPIEGVEALVKFMQEFQAANPKN